MLTKNVTKDSKGNKKRQNMKHVISKFFLSIIVSFFAMNSRIHAIVAGSENSVSIQSHTFFPAADADNEMRGFASFNHGFTLENAATSCIYNSLYAITGSIAMNGGTMYLQRDLDLKSTTLIDSLGTIVGNNHVIRTGAGLETFPTLLPNPSELTILQDVVLLTNGDLTITGSILFRGNCFLYGQGNAIKMNSGAFLVDSNSYLELNNTALKGVSGRNIQCIDDSGRIQLQSSTIDQTDHFFFSKGSILITEVVEWTGSYSFVYDSMQSSTIGANSSFLFDKGTLAIGRFNDSTTVEPLVFTNQTSILQLSNSTLSVNAHGMQLLKGTMEFLGAPSIDVASTSTAHALVVGDGILADDFHFIFDPGVTVNFVHGLIILDSVGLTLFDLTASNATLKRLAGTILFLAQNRKITNLILNTQPGALTIVAPGKTLEFVNVQIQTAVGVNVVNGFFTDGSTILLNGNKNISTIGGANNITTLIENSGNAILGAPSGFFNPITLQDSNAQLFWEGTGPVRTNMTMNGGSMSLITDFILANDILLSGSATIHLDSQSFDMGDIDITWSGAVYWDMTNGKINMNANLVLNNIWTFSGTSFLDGNGHQLDLTNGEIIVERGSTLLITDVSFLGLSGSKIRCLDGACVITLENVNWLQDGNFTFTQGALIFHEAVKFVGEGLSFAYQSTNTSFVKDSTSVTFDVSFTFSYDPGTYPDLIQFYDKSSQIFLNQATIHATAQGMSFTKGSIAVNALGTLSSEIVNGVDKGITFGDCFNGANDFAVNMASCINLTIASGSLNYKNVNSSSWLIINNLIFGDNTSLNLYKTLNNGTALTTFGLGTFLRTAPGATFNGSLSGSPTVQTDVLSC